MNKFIKNAALLCLLAYSIATPNIACAVYEGESDTGANLLDYIENRRRNEREKRLTEEQIELIKESNYIKEHLRKPRDLNSPVPTTFIGDDLTYNQVTGEFTAKGKVKIVTMDYQKMTGNTEEDEYTDEATIAGNLNSEEVSFPGKSRILELSPDGKHITLDGYNTFYRYGARTGTMEMAKGKVGHQYVSGKLFEFYPDKVIIFEGTTTKCNAHTPDYHLAADKITIYPNDRMVMEKVKFYVKGKLLFTRDRQVQSLDPNEEPQDLPRVGYTNTAGFWISYNKTREIYPKLYLSGRLYWSTKHHFRNRAEFIHKNAGNEYKIAYGYYADGDENWIMRSPAFIFKRDQRIGRTPFHYVAEAEIGKWKRYQKYRPNIESTHKQVTLGVYRDPLHLGGRWLMGFGTAYQMTKETYDDSLHKGFAWYVGFLKEFDPKYAWYATYEYSVVNKDNALFSYNTRDFARAVKTGLSYRMTDRDRFIVGLQYNEAERSLKDVDYYWFHDMHCSQFIIRYRAKRSSWQFRMDFTPW